MPKMETRYCFLEEWGASFSCAPATDRRVWVKKRALFDVPCEEFGQEIPWLLDVQSSGLAVREEISDLAVVKEKPKSRSFFIHLRRTGTDAVYRIATWRVIPLCFLAGALRSSLLGYGMALVLSFKSTIQELLISLFTPPCRLLANLCQ